MGDDSKQRSTASHQEEQQFQMSTQCVACRFRGYQKDTTHTGPEWNNTLFREQTARSAFIVSIDSLQPEGSTLQAVQADGLNEHILCCRRRTTFTPPEEWTQHGLARGHITHSQAERSTHQIWNRGMYSQTRQYAHQAVRALSPCKEMFQTRGHQPRVSRCV